MRLEINAERQMAIIWACSDESTVILPPEITAKLEPLRAKNKKFRVIVMHSGKDDLFEPMLTLLLRNRMKKALEDVREENKQDKPAV